jgi:hypothetical protein
MPVMAVIYRVFVPVANMPWDEYRKAFRIVFANICTFWNEKFR